MKDGVYVINPDYKNETDQVSLFIGIGRNTAVYFDSFGIEYIL